MFKKGIDIEPGMLLKPKVPKYQSKKSTLRWLIFKPCSRCKHPMNLERIATVNMALPHPKGTIGIVTNVSDHWHCILCEFFAAVMKLVRAYKKFNGDMK